MRDPKAILAELTPENAGDWQCIGDLMRRLSRISEVSAEGRPWHDVMLDALAGFGHHISSGHLHRIRRSFDFLTEGMTARSIPIERAQLAKISSIDQAERLFQLDREAGLDALEACLDTKKPATKADIQAQYEDYLDKHPEKKTPMQAAWDRRRSKTEKLASKSDVTRRLGEQQSALLKIVTLAGEVAAEQEKLSREISARVEYLEQELKNVNAELLITRRHLETAKGEKVTEGKGKGADWD